MNLTPRQLQVIDLAAQGLCGRAIAARLRLRASTIKQYRKEACDRLGANNCAHAVAICMGRGWIGRCDVALGQVSSIVVTARTTA